MVLLGLSILAAALCFFAALSVEIVGNENKEALKEACGSKLANKLLEYSKFHAEVLSQKQPQRYLVSVPVEAGLADRLTGLISHFWLAFFSKRAFQLGNYHLLPSFEYAYDYQFINWTRPSDLAKYTANLMFTYNGSRDYDGDRSYNPSIINTEEYFADYFINNQTRVQEVFRDMDLAEYPHRSKAFPMQHTVFTSSNRGGIRYIFENQYMKSVVKELEMNKYSAFRCAYNFLFKYNSATLHISKPFFDSFRQHHPQLKSLNSSSQSPSLLIGIGIRVGDHTFDPRQDLLFKVRTGTLKVRSAIACARRIEETYYNQQPNKLKELGMNLPWYVMADSLHTRRMIAEKYKKKVIIDTDTTYFHGDCSYRKQQDGCNQERLKHAITHAASQLQLFSMCNVHVIFKSGFPRVGAMLSKPPHHIYTQHKDCQSSKREDVDWIMTLGAGF